MRISWLASALRRVSCGRTGDAVRQRRARLQRAGHPQQRTAALTLSLLGGIVTGVVVTMTFRRAWLATARPTFWLTPLASLAVGVITFSLTTWLAWLLVGEPSSLSPIGQLAQILGTFVIYGLMSPIFTPVLYALRISTSSQFGGPWGHAT